MPSLSTGLGPDDRVVVICGGVGAARFLAGLQQVMDPANIVGIVMNYAAVTVAATPAAYTPWLRLYLSEHADQIFS